MKINWKLRLQNKATITALISAVVVCVYQIAGALGFTLPVTQEQIMSGAAAIITVLIALGVIIDPTTKGVSDSERAMGYDEPAPDMTEAEEDITGEDHE